MWSRISLLFLLLLPLTTTAETVFKPRKGEILLEWELTEGATKYEIEVVSYDGKIKKNFHSNTNAFQFKLTSEVYMFRGRTVNKDGIVSDWSEWRDLSIPFAAVPIKFEVASKEDVAEVKWKPVEDVKKFKVVAKEPKKKIVKEFIVQGTKLKTRLPAGKFQFSVQAVSEDGRETAAIEQPEPVKFFVEKEAKPVIAYDQGDINIKQIEGVNYNCALSYSPFMEDAWERVPVNSCKIKEIKTPLKPGRYRASVVSTSEERGDSDPEIIEFVVKPKDL